MASSGVVMTPYLDFPQLLAVLLRMLHEGNPAQRREVMKVRRHCHHCAPLWPACPCGPDSSLPKSHHLNHPNWHFLLLHQPDNVTSPLHATPPLHLLDADHLCSYSLSFALQVLGIIGALDPHAHKVNQTSLSGEGVLEKEGVRPLRAGTTEKHVTGPAAAGTLGAGGGADDFAADLLPSAGLMTASDEYYPTVAINALMRVLRDPSMSSQHQGVVNSLMAIFRALGLGSVTYLPKVMPVLFKVSSLASLSAKVMPVLFKVPELPCIAVR